MDFDDVVMEYNNYTMKLEQFKIKMWRYTKKHNLEDIKIKTSANSPNLFIDVYCDNESLQELFEKHKNIFIRKFNLKQISHQVMKRYRYNDKKITIRYTFVNKNNKYFEEE